MYIKSISFSEHKGTPQEWSLDNLTFCQQNLIVGRNASGKSRALAVTNVIARHLAGLPQQKVSSEYDCHFQNSDDRYRYQLQFRDDNVIYEHLSVNDKVLLARSAEGIGTIFAEEISGGTNIEFQTPTIALAAVARRDSIQHKFLEPLYDWASSVRFYQFGTQLGKESITIVLPSGAPPLDERDPNALVGVFRKAQAEFKDRFTDALRDDMARIGYPVHELGAQTPVSVRISGMVPGEVKSLYVREKDLPGITDQHSMSQGMYRAFAVLIYLNYFALKQSSTCLMIDDIGEGLDFERSCGLIDILREKATKSNVQLILSTNDRFVMNRVPMKEWSILQRKGNRICVRNFENSREIFEDFKFTGLSNFSFLEMDLINEDEKTRDQKV